MRLLCAPADNLRLSRAISRTRPSARDRGIWGARAQDQPSTIASQAISAGKSQAISSPKGMLVKQITAKQAKTSSIAGTLGEISAHAAA